MNTLLQTAQAYLAAGISVIPIRGDGSKAPAFAWKQYQNQRATPDELRGWFGWGVRQGIGVVCGQVSGNLEVIDFDDGSLKDFWLAELDERAPGVAERLVIVETPSQGWHAYYRAPEVAGNLKLAQYLEPTFEDDRGAHFINGAYWRIKVAIETRGEGGYAVAPGSPACVHPSGRYYSLFAGKLSDIPTVSIREREAMHEAARLFNRYIVEPKPIPPSPSRYVLSDRPGDDYSRRGDWADLLAAHGWKLTGARGDMQEWTRPGKSERGTSATVNYQGSNLLYVFSSNAYPFEPFQSYSLFAAYTILNHGGDFSAASRELALQGYGDGNDVRPIVTTIINQPEVAA